MSKTPPEWHAAAQALLDAGHRVPLIAKKLGKTPSMVRWALDIDNEREKTRNRTRAWRDTHPERGPRHVLPARPVAAKRPKAAKVDVMQIARDFAEGRIDRAELSRRLRGKA